MRSRAGRGLQGGEGSGWFPAHFICTAILRFLYRPRIILTAPSPRILLSFPPSPLPFNSRPWPPRFTNASGATTPCQDVKAVVKRRASAINHSRSRYYARNPRVGSYTSRWVGTARCVYMTFLSTIANPRGIRARSRIETPRSLARSLDAITVTDDLRRTILRGIARYNRAFI